AVAVSHCAATLHHRDEICLGSLHIHPVVGCMLYIFKYVSTLQQCLRGYTTPVETHAAQLGLLDHSHFHSKLRSSYGSNITTWSAPDDNDIVFRHMLGI